MTACIGCGRNPEQECFAREAHAIINGHYCHCVWERAPGHLPRRVAVGVCCARIGGGHACCDQEGRSDDFGEWLLTSEPLDLEYAALVASFHGGATPRPRVDVASAAEKLLDRGKNDHEWSDYGGKLAEERGRFSEERSTMLAEIDHLVCQLLTARRSIVAPLGGTGNVTPEALFGVEYAARLSEAASVWRTHHAARVVNDAAFARRVLAFAVIQYTSLTDSAREQVRERLGRVAAERLSDKALAIAGCAFDLSARGRRSREQLAAAKRHCGLDDADEVPDEIEALQRLGEEIGVPRRDKKTVQDQIQPLKAKLRAIRRERERALNAPAPDAATEEEAHEEAQFIDALSHVLTQESVFTTAGRRDGTPSATTESPFETLVYKSRTRC